MEWTNAQVLELIEMYRLRPVLWNCRLSEYKDRNKRHDAFVEIADNFKTDKAEVEKKIKSLLTIFAREVKKVKDSQKSGAGSDEIYVSKWYCYSSLLFLRDRNAPRNTIDTKVSRAHFIAYSKILLT